MKKILLILFFYNGWNCYGFISINPDENFLLESNWPDTISIAQSEKTEIRIIDGKKYFVYLFKSGDSWYKIAKNFKISYSELRLANKETDDKLFPGREILIPIDRLKPNDPFYSKKYIDSTSISSNKEMETKIHRVVRSQTLFGISKIYGISVEQIKKWNNLSSNIISPGQRLIVSMWIDSENENGKIEKAEVTSSRSTTIIKEGELNNINEMDNVANVNYEFPDEKIVFAKSRNEINENGLALKIEEEESNQEKYYALHRSAPVGTIIRVLCKENSKTIFVKITEQFSEASVNDGIIIKISKASADKLGITGKTFEVDLLYGVSK